jgi:hypothetical protein
MGIVEEECDETAYWLEMLVNAGLVQRAAVEDLIDEADQLVRIFVATINTTRARGRSSNNGRRPVGVPIRDPRSEIRNGLPQ